MSWHEDEGAENPELRQALKHFKASMDAWSDAAHKNRALSLPRTVKSTSVRRSWRPVAGWALGCLLVAGSLTIAADRIVHRQQAAAQAAQKAAWKTAEERAAAARIDATAQQNGALAAAAMKQEASAQDKDLMASVDQDISRQVPAAMEPLAQLMDDGGTE